MCRIEQRHLAAQPRCSTVSDFVRLTRAGENVVWRPPSSRCLARGYGLLRVLMPSRRALGAARRSAPARGPAERLPARRLPRRGRARARSRWAQRVDDAPPARGWTARPEAIASAVAPGLRQHCSAREARRSTSSPPVRAPASTGGALGVRSELHRRRRRSPARCGQGAAGDRERALSGLARWWRSHRHVTRRSRSRP